jgi:hypothetical protein
VFHTLDETDLRQPNSFVEQILVIHLRVPIAVLPRALVFAPVPAQKLRQ